MTKGREKETLSYHLLEVLGGPPEKVSEKNKYALVYLFNFE